MTSSPSPLLGQLAALSGHRAQFCRRRESVSEWTSAWKGWPRRVSKGEIPTLLALGCHLDSCPTSGP